MAEDTRISEEELKSLVASEIRSAINYDTEELASKRAKAIEYYEGVMTDTPAMAGRSAVVSRDVSDTIGWMLPGIIRVFTASDRIALFEPVEEKDEPFAEQATDYINYVFRKDNPGYRILWDATHDSLLQGNGIVKHYWDASEVCDYHEYTGLTDVDLAILQQDQYVEIVAQKEGEPQRVLDPQSGQEIDLPTFDVKIKRVTMNGRVKLECIEPENFLRDRNCRFIEEARFIAHRGLKSRSELIEMGFDREVIDNLPDDGKPSLELSEEALARRGYDWESDVGHKATRLIEIYECYVKADADGDGIAETLRVYYAGNAGGGELLDWEVWEDDVPFSDIPCEPVPHRWDARSVYDETADIQRINTVLTRGLLNNLYWVSEPMREAEVGSVVNPEMLATPKFGGTIWKKKGSLPIVPHVTPFVGDKVLAGLQHFAEVVEKRTGVSRSTMALDAEALVNQTATATNKQSDAAYSQVELIARNQAELGWKRVFSQLLKIIVKHQDRPRTIRLRDEWVEMDPRVWNANMDATINVGLGTGSRDRDMQMLTVVQGAQIALVDRFTGAGMAGDAIDMLPKIVDSSIKLAESAGLKNPETYFPDVSEEAQQKRKEEAAAKAEAPDPEVLKEEAKAKAKAEGDAYSAQLKAQAQQAADQLKAQAMREAEMLKAQAAKYKEDTQAQADLIVENAKRISAERIVQIEQSFEKYKFDREMAFKEKELSQKKDIEDKRTAAQAKAKAQQPMGAQPG